MLAERFGDRQIDVVADAAYVGRALRGLPEQITWTVRLRKSAVCYGLAPPRTGKRGRPRLRGDRLGRPAELAAHADWDKAAVARYGREDTVSVAEVRCLWYGVYHTQQVRVVLVREPGHEDGDG